MHWARRRITAPTLPSSSAAGLQTSRHGSDTDRSVIAPRVRASRQRPQADRRRRRRRCRCRCRRHFPNRTFARRFPHPMRRSQALPRLASAVPQPSHAARRRPRARRLVCLRGAQRPPRRHAPVAHAPQPEAPAAVR
eukprot:Amastigsp_a340083_59.p4 type:complete len:137 gc:universal Amastigsp_a340083_59:73-483(+)